MHAIPVCPLCRGDLAPNVHPLERRLIALVSAPMAVAVTLWVAHPGPWTTGLFGVAVSILVVASVYLHRKTRDWQRYKRYGDP